LVEYKPKPGNLILLLSAGELGKRRVEWSGAAQVNRTTELSEWIVDDVQYLLLGTVG